MNGLLRKIAYRWLAVELADAILGLAFLAVGLGFLDGLALWVRLGSPLGLGVSPPLGAISLWLARQAWRLPVELWRSV